MRLVLLILLIVLVAGSLTGFSQRPNLTIGAHVNQQLLNDWNLNQRYYTPGVAVDLEVSKNRFAGLASLGMKGAGPSHPDQNPGQFTKYFINFDLSFGFFLIKHPAFKWRFNAGVSNLFNLNKNHPGSQFNVPGYSLQAYPELMFRFKYYVASLFYFLPVVGFDTRGTGIKIGVGF
jgi:hypothetical protein